MPHLCIKPACGPDCSQCSRAISEETTLKYAARYAWLRDKAPGQINFDHVDGEHYFELHIPFDGMPIHDNEQSAVRLDSSIDAQIAAG